MSINEDSLGPSSDSFWDIDGYKPTVKRQEDGVRLCQDLMNLIKERSEIEKSYAKSLQAWSKKWQGVLDKGPEYGTTQGAWRGVLHESDSIADIHTKIGDNLLNQVQTKVKDWKQTNYKKAVVGVHKETKQLEDEFKKAQKPWTKKYTKVKEARKHYHIACKSLKSATNQENNAKADSSMSADQMKKVQDKVEKCHKDVETTRQKYEAALSDLNNYNAKYMEDMTMVYDKSDEHEAKRLVFFKEMLFGVHKCLDISQVVEVPQIYNQLHHTIDQADYKQDLKWYSQNHGKAMGMNWPQFDEYQEGHHAISRKEKTKSMHIGSSDGITLTGLKTENSNPSYNVSANGSSNSVNNSPPQASPNLQSQNPFGEDDFDDEEEQIDTSKGVPVRAVYDYISQEDDELTFKEGDIFLKLKDRDSQGWCTGLKDGRVGLFPDNYVQVTN